MVVLLSATNQLSLWFKLAALLIFFLNLDSELSRHYRLAPRAPAASRRASRFSMRSERLGIPGSLSQRISAAAVSAADAVCTVFGLI